MVRIRTDNDVNGTPSMATRYVEDRDPRYDNTKPNLSAIWQQAMDVVHAVSGRANQVDTLVQAITDPGGRVLALLGLSCKLAMGQRITKKAFLMLAEQAWLRMEK